MTAIAPTTDEITEFASSVSGTLSRCWPSPLVAGERDAGARRLHEVWSAAATQGWTELPEPTLLPLVLAAMHELGRVACPLPLMDVFVAWELLADRPELTDGIRDGTLRPLVLPASVSADTIRFVDAAEAATHVIALSPAASMVEVRVIRDVRPTPGLPRPAWADVTCGSEPLATIAPAADRIERAIVLLRLGLAARAAGAARHTHELALRHAGERIQFGKPIGAYQAVSHRAVDGATDLAALRALIDRAGVGAGSGDVWLLSAELAVAFARNVLARVQFDAHHTLAAVGYFEEHPAPWLFRRVHADLERIAVFAPAGGDAGDRLLEQQTTLPAFDLGEAAEGIRAEVREILARHPSAAQPVSRVVNDPDVTRDFADAGLLTLAWPREFGGRGASVEEQTALSEEVEYLRAPIANARSGAMLLAPAIMRHGNAEQQQRYLPLIARGVLRSYLGYSEPEVGSDLASLRTRAVRDGDDWVVTGQKMWGSGAHEAEHVWLAARTDPDAKPPHAGITVFLAPTTVSGWSAQQHRALSGEVSCTTFFDEVRIPDTCRIGEVNDGWKVIVGALASERVVMAGMAAQLLRSLDDLLEVLRRDPEGLAGPRGSAKRRRLTELAARLQAARALSAAGLRATAAGGGARLEAPMAKVMTGELSEDFGQAMLELLGPEAALGEQVPGVPGGGAFEYDLRWSIMLVVGGGTADIQRNLIARGLGLPR